MKYYCFLSPPTQIGKNYIDLAQIRGFWLEGWRNLLVCQLPRIHILTKNSPMKISFYMFSLTLRVLKICFHDINIIISAFWCSVHRIIVPFSRSANYH